MMYTLGISVIFVLVVATILRISVIQTGIRPFLRDTEIRVPTPGDSPSELVVLIHAWLRSARSLDGLEKEVRQIFPNSHLLIPKYSAGFFSNANPWLIASALEQAVERAFERYHYARIILIGHSSGALIVRKAFVWGCGLTEDRPGYIGETGLRKEWTNAVERILLLAGTNRGWRLKPRPTHMTTSTFLAYYVSKVIMRLTQTGRFVLSLERGAPFIADLRLQWVRLAKSAVSTFPLVVQLQGDIDDVVTHDDNKDVEASCTFQFTLVPQTGHYDIIEFGDDVSEDVRRDAFRSGLLTARAETAGTVARKALHIVFIMHGIRDFGDWTMKMRSELEQGKRGVLGITSQYGYFPMMRFLLVGERQRHVRWFVDRYTEEMAQHGPETRISFIGHSNGTYLLASALSHYSQVKFHRCAFVGTVVPASFPWRKYAHKYDQVANYVGSADWVVGIFPGFFELLGLDDVGSAGLRGFNDDVVHRNEVRYVRGGHSRTLQTKLGRASISRFILDGKSPHEGLDDITTERIQPWVDILSKLCWMVWLGLMFGAIGLGWGVCVALQALGMPYLVSMTIFVSLLVALLLTV